MGGDVYVEGVGVSSNGFGVLSLAAWLVVGLAGACGGSPAGSGEPAVTPHEKAPSPASDSSGAEDEGPAEEEATKPALCDDGTCSRCGTGICPTGWYCDESAKGGAACGWLPQCVQKVSCACLTKVLGSACSCSEQASGLHVTCQ
ncbi:MAG: hypothetical protein ABI548_16525 [Polyangiaceae bacterium]